MPPPTISYCILCESVRPEPNGKANILGFYGVLPTGNVMVNELGKSVPMIMFLVGLLGPGDESTLRGRITNPDGSILFEIAETDGISLPLVASQQGALGGLGFAGLKFTKEGTYTVDLFLNNVRAYQSSFTLKEGSLP